ncbi:MAG: DNA topoisomerase, partial [Clostridiales bacterium]|nr:DNA topoisomerase [Clostridiales bacterium]
GFRILKEKGFMKVTGEWKFSVGKNDQSENEEEKDEEKNYIKDPGKNPKFLEALSSLRKGHVFEIDDFQIREGETSPPKRYTSGSIILAMENAGQLIEDEELRAQIKGSGIGTSATRAEILKKLITIRYLALNKKTQVITPTLLGEVIFDTVYCSIRSLLNPELTASWEKGLTQVAEGRITEEEYMEKLVDYIRRRTEIVMGRDQTRQIEEAFYQASSFYKKS